MLNWICITRLTEKAHISNNAMRKSSAICHIAIFVECNPFSILSNLPPTYYYRCQQNVCKYMHVPVYILWSLNSCINVKSRRLIYIILLLTCWWGELPPYSPCSKYHRIYMTTNKSLIVVVAHFSNCWGGGGGVEIF